MKHCHKIIALLSLSLSLVLMSCSGPSQKKKTEKTYVLYDINADHTGLATEEYYPKSKDRSKMTDEILDLLGDKTEKSDMTRPIPNGVNVQDTLYDKESGNLTVSFTRSYMTVTGTDETLMRAAIVKTLLQVKGVKTVTFQVDHTDLVSASGISGRMMDDNTFVMSMAGKDSPVQSADITLYYPDRDGTRLHKVKKKVTYSSNIHIARVVIDYLKKNPEVKNARPALPSGIQVSSLAVADGVCYVNFDSDISSKNNDVTEEACVYSIVDSLTDLYGINRVQISENGSNLSLRGHEGTLFEKNDTNVINK